MLSPIPPPLFCFFLRMMDALSRVKGCSRDPLEFSFSFSSPKSISRGSNCTQPPNTPSPNVTPALMCIYCGGLYSRTHPWNAKSGGRDFVCIHCAKRIEAEIEEVNSVTPIPDVQGQPSNRTNDCKDLQELLSGIMKSLELLKAALSESDTHFSQVLDTMNVKIEELTRSLAAKIESPVVPRVSPKAVRKPALPDDGKHCEANSVTRCFKTSPSMSSRGYTAKHSPQKKLVDVVGDSNVGYIEGVVNERLAGDRRCRFFVYRRSNFRKIVNVARNRIRSHDPKKCDLRVILHAGLDDVLSAPSDLAAEALWGHFEASLNGLLQDCLHKNVSLVVYSIPLIDTAARVHYTCHYINRKFAEKFENTRVAYRDFHQERANVHNSTSFAAQQISSEIAAYLGLSERSHNWQAQAPSASRRCMPSVSSNGSPSAKPPYDGHKSFFQQVPPPPLPPPLLRCLPIIPASLPQVPIPKRHPVGARMKSQIKRQRMRRYPPKEDLSLRRIIEY